MSRIGESRREVRFAILHVEVQLIFFAIFFRGLFISNVFVRRPSNRTYSRTSTLTNAAQCRLRNVRSVSCSVNRLRCGLNNRIELWPAERRAYQVSNRQEAVHCCTVILVSAMSPMEG